MISSIRHKQSVSWTFSNDAMTISAKEIPKNHTDKERFAAASSCIEKGILTLLFPRKRRRFSPSPFISHRVLEAVASQILIVNCYMACVYRRYNARSDWLIVSEL